MSLVKELQRLVKTWTPLAGRVVSVSVSKVVVATASGQIEVSAKGDLLPGDQVTIEAGMATKKQRSGETRVTYRNKQSSMFCPGSCET
jgi:hypothetical protein